MLSALDKLLESGAVRRGGGASRSTPANTPSGGFAQVVHNCGNPGALSTGVQENDAYFAEKSLKKGTTHEWFGWEIGGLLQWFSPLTILTALALGRPSSKGGPPLRGGIPTSSPEPDFRLLIWIGRRVWPAPAVLGRTGLARSLFLDPEEPGARLWAIDQCLRCPDVDVVIADGSGLDMASSRRLQLAAESNPNPIETRALALLARPPRERPPRTISAAETRWCVTPHAVPGSRFPCWRVELLRCKGAPMAQSRSWIVEWAPTGDGRDLPNSLAFAPVALRARADVADRPIETETAGRRHVAGA